MLPAETVMNGDARVMRLITPVVDVKAYQTLLGGDGQRIVPDAISQLRRQSLEGSERRLGS
jgi:hypothetical protein